MDAIHLPEDIKHRGYDAAKRVLDRSEAKPWEKANLLGLMDHVMQTDRDPQQWDTFIRETNKLDRVRSSSILDIIPEYSEYWHDGT